MPAGKLNWPLSFDTTVVVMVEPSRLALTSTPSIAPSSVEETLPLNACACDATTPAAMNMLVASRSVLNLMNSLPWVELRRLHQYERTSCIFWHLGKGAELAVQAPKHMT